MQDYRSNSVNRLFHALSLLKTDEEYAAFLEDLCTITEIIDMAQRLEGAILLKNGENYTTITKDTGMSTATISRVSKCLNYGSGGYENVIALLEAEKQKADEV